MEVPYQDSGLDSGSDQTKNCENHSSPVTQAESTSETGDVPDPLSAKIPCSNGIGHRGSDESWTDIVITNEDALLLPDHVPVIPHRIEKESPVPLSDPTPQDSVTNGSSPICNPPTVSTGQRAPGPKHLPKCNGHRQPIDKHLPSGSKSKQSLKSNATQIEEVADGDCCVHCVLACLFCEVLSLCSALAQCLACGLECEACCCAEAGGGLSCCTEDPCSALLDCAILEDCCQSSDCLEMCLDCCSICFPA